MMNPIVIVVVCDNHYTILLAALLKSIGVNHKTDEEIIVYIIEDGISKSNKEKLINSINEKTFSINWLKLEDSIPKGIKLPLDESSWPLNLYGRLFIPYFISNEIKKVIYLDVDMVVEDDISKLWHLDLKGNTIGAVQDPRVLTFNNDWGGGVQNYEELGLDGNLPYMNAGLLVIDIEKWKNQKIGEKVVETITTHMKYANFPDQYGLNVVLANNWLELNPLWNHFSDTKTEEHPKLIHFIAKKPIYKETNALPEFKDIFYKYLKQTEWKDFKSRATNDIYIKKIRNKLLKKWRKFFN